MHTSIVTNEMTKRHLRLASVGEGNLACLSLNARKGQRRDVRPSQALWLPSRQSWLHLPVLLYQNSLIAYQDNRQVHEREGSRIEELLTPWFMHRMFWTGSAPQGARPQANVSYAPPMSLSLMRLTFGSMVWSYPPVSRALDWQGHFQATRTLATSEKSRAIASPSRCGTPLAAFQNSLVVKMVGAWRMGFALGSSLRYSPSSVDISSSPATSFVHSKPWRANLHGGYTRRTGSLRKSRRRVSIPFTTHRAHRSEHWPRQ